MRKMIVMLVTMLIAISLGASQIFAYVFHVENEDDDTIHYYGANRALPIGAPPATPLSSYTETFQFTSSYDGDYRKAILYKKDSEKQDVSNYVWIDGNYKGYEHDDELNSGHIMVAQWWFLDGYSWESVQVSGMHGWKDDGSWTTGHSQTTQWYFT